MKHKTERKVLVGRPSPRLGDTGCEGTCSPVPDIRFKEFREPWNAHLLGQMFEEREERSSEKSLLSVTMAGGVIRADENGKRDNSSADKSNYKCVYPGDLAYNSMRMWQGACGASIYEGIVSPAYTVMKPTNETDSFFFVRLFKQPQFLKVFKAFSQGLTSDTWNLKFPMLSTIPCQTPALPEQQKISSFFANLDQAIAAAQARLEKLRQAKVAMLKKMFPQPKQSVPEIRFKGFMGNWDCFPLEEIATVVADKNDKLEATEAFTNSAEKGIVSQRDYFDFDVAKRLGGYSLVRPDDFVYNPRISIVAPFGPINRNCLGRVGAMSPLYFVFRAFNIDLDYLQVYFKTKCWHPFMRFNGDSGARSDRFSIRNDLFMKLPVFAPHDPEEQQRVAVFFKELDSLIATTGKKVVKLRQIKAALSEGMFV